MSRQGPLRATNRPVIPESGVAEATRLAVVYATDFDRTSPGGIMNGLKELARNLSDHFRLIIFGLGDSQVGIPTCIHADGVGLTLVPVMRAPRHMRIPLNIIFTYMRIPLNIIFTLRLFWLKGDIERQADLLLFRRMENALPFIIYKRRPIVLSIHGSSQHLDLPQTGFLRWRIVRTMFRFIEGFVLAKVDRVVIVGPAEYEYYSARYPRLRHKFLQIPNCINMSKFSAIDRAAARSHYGLRESDLVIAYAGRLSAVKQVDLLIDVFSRISRERPNAYLLIAGVGPEESALRKQVDRLGLSNVRFLGWLTRDELRILLSSADVFALISLHEDFSNAVLEALACGVPVVAADVGGMRELLAGRLQRFIVSSYDPNVIRTKILEAADERARLVDVCLEQAKQYDARTVVPKLENLYRSVAGARG